MSTNRRTRQSQNRNEKGHVFFFTYNLTFITKVVYEIFHPSLQHKTFSHEVIAVEAINLF